MVTEHIVSVQAWWYPTLQPHGGDKQVTNKKHHVIDSIQGFGEHISVFAFLLFVFKLS